MPITIKKLIAELEKIENKFLEVEILNPIKIIGSCEISDIRILNKKCVLITKEFKKK